MTRFRKGRRVVVGGATGLVCGIAGGVAGVALLAGGASGGAREAGDSLLTAGHLPPLLTVPGEHVTLRYAIVCPPPDGDAQAGDPCDAAGTVYVRAGHTGAFEALPLRRGADSADGRYVADVPARIASSPDGFSYFAVLRDRAHGTEMTLPAGGAAAPQDSYPLRNAATVDLGPHVFGATRHPVARVVAADWGSGTQEVGLSGGKASVRIGPSGFDVSADGTVTLLDEINHRVQRWRDGGVRESVPVNVPAAVDDLAAAPNGAFYVLDGRSVGASTPLLRTFDADGQLITVRHIAERTWSQLRLGPDGPVVQQSPSEQWMPAADGALAFDRAAQARGGNPGRPLEDGSRLVVLRTGAGEVRIARVVNGAVRRSWRIRSATPLGEVQVADPLGGRVVLVVKAYTDSDDEFDVLVLDGRGAVKRFTVESSEWAEAAPLGRFRLVGSALYHLGSTPEGVFVDRYDLEGAQ
jgi:hypothetical protein